MTKNTFLNFNTIWISNKKKHMQTKIQIFFLHFRAKQLKYLYQFFDMGKHQLFYFTFTFFLNGDVFSTEALVYYFFNALFFFTSFILCSMLIPISVFQCIYDLWRCICEQLYKRHFFSLSVNFTPMVWHYFAYKTMIANNHARNGIHRCWMNYLAKLVSRKSACLVY